MDSPHSGTDRMRRRSRNRRGDASLRCIQFSRTRNKPCTTHEHRKHGPDVEQCSGRHQLQFKNQSTFQSVFVAQIAR